MAMAKDFLIGFPNLKHRNMGGFLLFSSEDRSMSVGTEKKTQRFFVSSKKK